MYSGCATNFIGVESPMTGYHGKDGHGDIEIQGIDPVDMSLLQKEHAASAIVKLVSDNPGMAFNDV